MNTIEILSATTNETDDPFTVEMLQKLAESASGVPVTVDFDPEKIVGNVIGSAVTKDGLVISAEINTDAVGMYLVPGFTMPDYISRCYGLTENPRDETLPKISKEHYT